MKNNNQFLHGDQARCEENFCRVDHERSMARDLFAVANLLVFIYEAIKCPAFTLIHNVTLNGERN